MGYEDDIGYIDILYSRKAFDSMMEKVKSSFCYSVEEKTFLTKMLIQMKREDWLLYMAEIYHENQFDFPIPNFEKLKKYLIAEVYRELLDQLIEANVDYEKISYDEIRKWFAGMSINIAILSEIDRRFCEVGVEIIY